MPADGDGRRRTTFCGALVDDDGCAWTLVDVCDAGIWRLAVMEGSIAQIDSAAARILAPMGARSLRLDRYEQFVNDLVEHVEERGCGYFGTALGNGRLPCSVRILSGNLVSIRRAGIGERPKSSASLTRRVADDGQKAVDHSTDGGR